MIAAPVSGKGCPYVGAKYNDSEVIEEHAPREAGEFRIVCAHFHECRHNRCKQRQSGTQLGYLAITRSIHLERPTRTFKYYDFVLGGFVCVLLCSNLIGPAKICRIGGFAFGAGNLFFPISYIFGDILTEVYGYARSRRVI